MFLAQTLPFVHPALAGAAMAAGLLPVLVHLINRRRHRRVPWAAMRFLLAAHRRSARRVWIEQVLLMAARIALVVLLGLALARPYTPANALVPVSSARVHRVLILDNSLSMKASAGSGPTRFEIAASYAAQLLASFPQGDPVSLVTAAAPAEALIAHAAYDRRFVRERLSGVRSTQRSADIVGAIGKAQEIVRESETPEGNQAVYLLSDLPEHVWKGDAAEGDAPALAALRQLRDSLGPSAHSLNVIRVPGCGEEPGGATTAGNGTPCAIENVAITRLDVDTPLLAVGLPVRVSFTVKNTGSRPTRNITVQVRRNGQIVREEPIPQLAPDRSRMITLSTPFLRPGTHVLEARVVGARQDALAEDDARYLSVDVRESIPVLLVDGRPGTTLLTGEAGFLATALAPNVIVRGAALGRPATDLAVVPTVVAPSDVTGESLERYDVVALCNVARLSEADWQRLSHYVVGGGGLMIFGGDLIDAEHYNDAGAAVVPGTLGRTVQGGGGSGLEPTHAEAAGVGFAAEGLVHPIVANFADHPASSLFLAGVRRYLSIEPDPQHAEVILRYTNGDPAVVVSSRAEGSVLLFTTTADMDWTNLPAKGDFVSLVFNAVAFLAKEHGAHRNILVGQTIREPLTAAESSMEILVATPSGAAADPALEPKGDGLSMRFGPVEESGVVTASIGGSAWQFVANVDPQESAVVPLAESALRNRLDGPFTVVTARGTPGGAAEAGALARRSAPYNELASLFAYAALALLLAEVWMGARFGAPRHRKDEGVATGRISTLPFLRVRRDESARMVARS